MTELKHARLSGTVQVPLPPEEAFNLFTPQGMRAWRPSWEPRFLSSGDDPNEPGTVFNTVHNGDITHWIIIQCQPGRPIVYARAKPGMRAGTATVIFDSLPGGATEVTVSYDLTALTPEGNALLEEWAAQYPRMLGDWQQFISRAINESHLAA